MPRDVLREYGPESAQPQKPRATSGGVTAARDVRNYSPPQGPTSINNPKSPGLHGTNHGHQQKCYADGGSGSPVLHGENKGKSGSQR